jgi:hypothetical protein
LTDVGGMVATIGKVLEQTKVKTPDVNVKPTAKK